MDAFDEGVQFVKLMVAVTVTDSAGDPSNVADDGVESDIVADPEHVPDIVKLSVLPLATRVL